MKKDLGLYLLSVRFGGRFISGSDHISFVREADIEVLQLFGKILDGLSGALWGAKILCYPSSL